MIVFFVIVTILWTLGKQFQGSRVVGKKITVKPIRKDSKLAPFLKSEMKIEQSKIRRENSVWLSVSLNPPVKINDLEFDYLAIQPKKVDDNVNTKKGVVCTIRTYSILDPSAEYFVDYGVVQAIK
jgi:hypothetical protein